jgi:hypothetical protein
MYKIHSLDTRQKDAILLDLISCALRSLAGVIEAHIIYSGNLFHPDQWVGTLMLD